MNRKRWASLLLAGAMALSLAACTNEGAPSPSPSVQPSESPAPGASPAGAYRAGTYTASAAGKNGDVTVEVVFTEAAIKSVTVTAHQETEGIAEPALERVPKAVVDGQTLAVDAVAGATITRDAILAAVESCVAEAGGDAAALKTPAAGGEKETVSYEADAVIVGAGAAGMNAALEASQAGLKVLVLEKGATIGVSNAAQAGGPSACETVVQAEEDQTVTVETLFRYMYDYSHSLANAGLLRNVLSVSGETINSMVEAGVGMYLRPDNYGAGFRARHGFEERGDDRFQPVKEKVESLGGQFLLETAGKSVIMENGAAAGVLAERSDGTPVEVRAKAVLICTGGYLGNEAMMAEHFGEVKINPLGNTLSDGAGINMVVEAGGVLDRNWSIIANEFAGANQKGGGWSFSANQNFKYAVYGGLMVNREGERFFNEEVIATMALSEGGEATLREGLYYSVIDQAYFDACREEGIYSYLGSPENWYVGKMTLAAALLDQNEAQLQEAIDQGWACKADTIEEAAAYFGLENLPQTVAEYNAMCEAGEDTRFYKDPTFLTSVSEGPFYVFEYEPSAWGTLGGVKVDSRLRALTAGNEAIPGLYVAGVDAGSMYTAPYYSNEGAALGLAMASGTWAAKEMVQYLAG